MWYYTYNGLRLGPVDINGLTNLMRSGMVDGASMIWREGWDEWKRLNETDLIWLYDEIKGQPLMQEADEEEAEGDDDAEVEEAEEKIWYYQQDGYTWGPVGAGAVQRLLQSGEVEDVTLVRRAGEAVWHHLDETDLVWLMQESGEEPLDEDEEDDFGDEETEDATQLDEMIEAGAQVWYYIRDDRIYGPVTTDEIVLMRAQGEVYGQSQVSKSENGPWMLLDETELADLRPDTNESEEE
jgi:hypothetical protein